MTILQKILIASFLFSLVNCTCTSYLRDDGSNVDYDYGDDFMTGLNYKDRSASKKECKKRTFSEEEKEDNAYKCCYAKIKCNYHDSLDDIDVKADYEGCVYIDKNSYDNIKKMIEPYKKNCDKFSINCSGTSLSYAYMMLIMLFLL